MSNHATIGPLKTDDTITRYRWKAIRYHLAEALRNTPRNARITDTHAATGHTIRALSLLKQECSGAVCTDLDEPTPDAIKTEIDRALALGFKVEAIKHLDWHIGTKKHMRVEWARIKTLPKLKALNDAAQAAKTGGAA